MFACVTFEGLHWPSVVAMLSSIDSLARAEVLRLFKAFVQRTHGNDIAKWLSEYWKYVEMCHFDLIKTLKS